MSEHGMFELFNLFFSNISRVVDVCKYWSLWLTIIVFPLNWYIEYQRNIQIIAICSLKRRLPALAEESRPGRCFESLDMSLKKKKKNHSSRRTPGRIVPYDWSFIINFMIFNRYYTVINPLIMSYTFAWRLPTQAIHCEELSDPDLQNLPHIVVKEKFESSSMVWLAPLTVVLVTAGNC